MGKIIKTEKEVEDFLEKVKELTWDDERTTINSAPWAGGRVNKTRQYMAETGIDKKTILNVVRELEICNYSSTQQDYNPNFPDECIWEFGLTVVFHIIYNFMLHIIYHRFRNCHSGFSTLFNPNYAY